MILLTEADIRAALTELAERLARRGAFGQLYVVGGAAMVLVHGAGHSTRDIDAAIVDGYGAVTEEAALVARAHGWPSTWINEQATAYMPPPELRRGETVLDHPGLLVTAASAEHMLAMKARAARRTDVSDVRRLIARTGIGTVSEIAELVETVFAGEPLDDRQRNWLQAVISRTDNSAER